MISVFCLLAVCAFLAAILSLMGKCPLVAPVLLLALIEVLHCLPLR